MDLLEKGEYTLLECPSCGDDLISVITQPKPQFTDEYVKLGCKKCFPAGYKGYTYAALAYAQANNYKLKKRTREESKSILLEMPEDVSANDTVSQDAKQAKKRNKLKNIFSTNKKKTRKERADKGKKRNVN